MKVIIAEKRSQAEKLAAPFKHSERNGYFELPPQSLFPKGAYITWAAGHLFSLAQPEFYDEKYKSWMLHDLPIIPEQFKYQLTKGKSKQFQLIKGLLQSSKVSEIIIGTDPGREGESIGRIIVHMSGVKKPIKRLWTTSLTANAVLKAFQHLLNGNEKIPLYYEAQARAYADWLIGMNTSRAYTVLLQGKGYQDTFSSGRVQTVLLSLIVQREEEMENFVSSLFWEVYGEFLIDGKNYQGKWFKGQQQRLDALAQAQALAEYCKGKDAHVWEVKTERKKIDPPRLFSLSTLQPEANRRFKMSPEKVYSICQELYLKEHISYPRSDSEYVTEEEALTFPDILEMLQKQSDYKAILPAPIKSLIGNKRFVDASKTSDHYAIIPTENVPNLSSLPEEERVIYDLITRRLITAHYPAAEEDHTSIISMVDGKFTFHTKGKRVIEQGWRVATGLKEEQQSEAKDGHLEMMDIPLVQKGQAGKTAETKIKEGQTTSPPRFTEGDLITLMKTAGKGVNELDPDIQKILRETEGLGTEATRAAIIGTLKDKEYIFVKKNLVYPTEKGRLLIRTIGKESVLASAALTGQWEKQLREIGKGKASHQKFLEEIKGLTSQLVKEAIGHVQRMTDPHSTSLPAAPKTQSTTEKTDKEERIPEKIGTTARNLYDRAKRIVLESGQASASLLQRRLRIGYTQAAGLIDQLEADGIVGTFESGSPRKVWEYPHEGLNTSSTVTSTGTPTKADKKQPGQPEKEDISCRAIPKKEEALGVGPCPLCRESVVIDKGNFYGCSAYAKTGCGFTISKIILGVIITPENIKKLLRKGETDLIEGFQRKEVTFNAVLVWGSGKIHFRTPNATRLSLPLTLLEPSTMQTPSKEDEKREFILIEKEAATLKYPVKVVGVTHGPRVSRYELLPNKGINIMGYKRFKANFQAALKANKLSLYLPIPGSNYIGIEVPNRRPYPVQLRGLLENQNYLAKLKDLSFPIGMNLQGQPVFANLVDMPHLLVAGTTGSGKSVFINSLIISLLYGSTPQNLKFMFIDPKQVELSVYSVLPNLVCPIVTQVQKTGAALKYLIDEMDSRYHQFMKTGVRNILGYNEKNPSQKLPYIVLVIDELADLLMLTDGGVEDQIQRLSQLARAAGIHMIIATQRPTKKVLSPTIKANLPVRIAFAVASTADSMTILDQGGAEDLLGRGDMIYLPKDGAPARLQSAYVSDEEIERVVSYTKTLTS